jgi:GR25 family glycosyltransferase involved in LPS biosynthesis
LRLDAVDAAAGARIYGKLRSEEKACFLSHRATIAKSIELPGHTMILEDDALFGASSVALIDCALAGMPESYAGTWVMTR